MTLFTAMCVYVWGGKLIYTHIDCGCGNFTIFFFEYSFSNRGKINVIYLPIVLYGILTMCAFYIMVVSTMCLVFFFLLLA